MQYAIHNAKISATILTYLLTYLLTPWCIVLLEKLTGLQQSRNSPYFMEPEGSLPHSQASATCLSWASPIQSMYPHPTSWRSILILSTHLRLSPQWSPSLRLPHQDPIHPPLLTHTRHMPNPSHSSRCYHPKNIGRGVQII